MAAINFLAGGYLTNINNLANSGLGFFSAVGFGQSVTVGAWQGSTFITDGNGINQGPQTNNVMYIHPNSGVVQSATTLNLNQIPNYQSTLNIRFTNSSPVRTQQAQLFIYDRFNVNNPPSSLICAVAPIIHPDLIQNGNGSGLATWQFPAGSSYVDMSRLSNGSTFSPGMSGQSPNGPGTTDTQHDFYCAISASPNTIGPKTQFGLLFSVEYL